MYMFVAIDIMLLILRSEYHRGDPIALLFSSSQKILPIACKQQRRKPACASAQSDQFLCYWLIEKYIYI